MKYRCVGGLDRVSKHPRNGADVVDFYPSERSEIPAITLFVIDGVARAVGASVPLNNWVDNARANQRAREFVQNNGLKEGTD